MKPENVNPKKWHDPVYPKKVLYDDGEYSVIWGKYQGRPALGGRWNGEDDEIGFPNQGGNPTWFVQPDIFAELILKELLIKARLANDTKKVSALLFSTDELKKKMARKSGEELKPIEVNLQNSGAIYKALEERIKVNPDLQWFVHWLSIEDYASNKDLILSFDNVVVCVGEFGFLQNIFNALEKIAKGNNHRIDDNLIAMKQLYIHSKPKE